MININIPYPRVFLPRQKEVLDAINKHNKRMILYSGAYGAGKTLLMSNIVIMECLRYPKSLWFFGAQTIPNLRDTVVRTFLEEIGLFQEQINIARSKLGEDSAALNIKLQKYFNISTMSFKFFNGSEVLFRSCDDASKFKSLNLDGFAIDEPVDIDEDVFLMLQGRIRARHTDRNLGIMAGNPAGRMNWVYQKFFEKPLPDYYVVHTTTYDNTFLSADYITGMEQSYDEDYKRRYLYGEWGSFEGQVYKDFNYNKHVGNYRDHEVKYHMAGFDDGTRNPAALLVIGVDNDKNLFIKDEFYETGMVDAEKTEAIAAFDMKYNFQKVYADPSALSMIESMTNKRIRVRKANNDIDMGVSKLKSFFKNDIIHIDKKCRHLIKELESYRYEKDKQLFRKNKTEVPIKKNDHLLDALRYSITEFNPFRKPTMCSGTKW